MLPRRETVLQTSDDLCDSGDSTGGRGQALRMGRPLVGGLSFHGVSGMRARVHWHTGCQVEFRLRDEKAADAGLGLSFFLEVGKLLVIHMGGAQCGEQRGPDLKHSAKKN